MKKTILTISQIQAIRAGAEALSLQIAENIALYRKTKAGADFKAWLTKKTEELQTQRKTLLQLLEA